MPAIQLPPEMIAKIGRAQQRITALIPELDKCENCGMEVGKLREMVAEQLKYLQALDQNFGTPLYQRTTLPPSSSGSSEDLPGQ